MTTMIRILLADDHPVVRQCIRQIAGAAGDMIIADEAANGSELLERARTVEHDLILLDLSMPDTSGFDLLKQLKRERPKIPVVILTMYSENQFAIRAVKAGAAGHLMKDSAAAELAMTVRKAVDGAAPVPEL
jgi:two-component system invasion response regulator UvrY